MPLGRNGWISRDAVVIIAARTLHTFSQGTLAVLLGVYLARIGLPPLQVGLFFSFGFAGAAVLSFVSTLFSERVGRRTLLAVYTLMTAGAGAALVVTNSPAALMLFAFLGSFNGAAGNVGPTQPLEQAALAGVVRPERRTDLFAVYRVAATTAAALGALGAGLPVLAQSAGADELTSFRLVLGLLVVLRLAVLALFAGLSEQVEARSAVARRPAFTNPLTLPSRRRIFTLTGLFSLDHLAGAIVVQGLLALWFSNQYGFDLGELALLFFASRIVGIVSPWISAKLANRIGLINTMTWAHLPGALFLVAVAFSPWGWLAVAFYLARSLFDQLDVAARDSYIMAVVEDRERVAMGSIHILGRSVTGAIGPTLSTGVLQAIGAAAPLIGSALVKTAYVVALYAMYRNVRTPEEIVRREALRD